MQPSDHAATTFLRDLVARQDSAHSLDRAFYDDPRILEFELDVLFARAWLLAAYSCQLREPGAYITCTVADRSVLIVRGEDARLRAFHNHCTHRGTTLCEPTTGCARRFVCPYHGWSFALDGRLQNTPELLDNRAKQLSLREIHLREIAGLIFVCLDPTPAPSAELEPLGRLLAPHRLEMAKLAHSWSYEVEANWKLVVENQRECYHCHQCHPEYNRAQYDADVHNPKVHAEIAKRLEECREAWSAQPIDLSFLSARSNYTGKWARANRSPFRPGYVTESLDGKPVAPLMGDFTQVDVGTARAGTYFNFWLHASGDHAVSISYQPISPHRTALTASWLVRADAVAGRDYQLDRLCAFTQIQLEQDKAILDRQGRAVRRRSYAAGPYTIRETNVRAFVSWYLAALGEKL